MLLSYRKLGELQSQNVASEQYKQQTEDIECEHVSVSAVCYITSQMYAYKCVVFTTYCVWYGQSYIGVIFIM